MKTIKQMMEEKKFMKETETTLQDFGFIDKPEKTVKKKKVFDIIKIAVIAIEVMIVIFLSIRLIMNITVNSAGSGTISCNLVAEKGSSHPAFLGYSFSKELKESIENGDIDLYGLYIARPDSPDVVNGYIYETKDAVPGTAAKIKITKIEYIKYTDEYIHKYFTKGYEHAEDGYYKYTIDLA